MNDEIRVPEVRCNVDGGESLGIISTDEAMDKEPKFEGRYYNMYVVPQK